MQKRSAANLSSTRIFELREYEPLRVPQNELSRELGELLWRDYTKQILVEFPSPKTKDCWQLTSQGFVGAIALAPDLQLQLQPKVPLQNVLHLWEYAYGFEPEFGSELIHCQGVAEFYESLAIVVAKRVLACAREGFVREYVAQAESLPYVRGKIDVTKLQKVVVNSRVPCRYNLSTIDIEENQILAYTLSSILRSALCSPRIESFVRRALRSLDGVTLRPFTADACVGRVYTRQNFDYKPLHVLCRFFLEGSSPSHESGEVARHYSMLPFLIDMERLFEQFLGEWLRRNLPVPWKLQTQHRVPLENDLAFRIDFVVNDAQSGVTAFVADAKYKAAPQPSTQDIAQVVAYAKSKHCHNAVLIYPQALQKPLDIHVGDVRVRSVVFDLGSDWKKGKTQFMSEIFALD